VISISRDRGHVSSPYAYDGASSAALHKVGPTQSVRVTACNPEWVSPLAADPPARGRPSIRGGLTLPGGGIKYRQFQGDPRQGAEKPLANRLDLIVADGSAEIL
jgi:hypothetical protein